MAPEPRSSVFPLSSLKSNLTCSICQGYLIDATTITECMHTFCKSCLLQRVESGRSSCPRCGTLVQRSRLSEQLRLDHAVQALVYASVPGLWREEQRRRKHFVDHHPLSSSVAPKLQQPTCFSPTDPISLSLDFIPQSNDGVSLNGPNSPQAIGRRYFRCPAAVTVHHFQKLLSLKFELPSHFVVEIYCSNEKQDPSFRLMDVAYKTSWTQEEPLRLEYKITRSQATKTSTWSSVPSTVNTAPNSSTWRPKTTPSTPSEPSGNVAPGVKRSSGSPSPTPAPSKPSKRARSEESERKVAKSKSDESPVKRRGRKKKRKRKSADLVPVMEPEHPLKVKIVERTKTADWNRPSGVELLVQAAEFTSRQDSKAPTPPPPPPPPPQSSLETKPTPPPEPAAAKEADVTSTPAPTTPKRASSPPGLIPINPISMTTSTTDALNNNENEAEEKKEDEKPKEAVTTLPDDEDDGHLMIADEVNSNENSRQSNGRDSGMANDDEEEDDSNGALDLSSKSTRSTPPIEAPLAKKLPVPEPRKTCSPQLVQQRSTTLHSITDSLAQRQHQLLMQQRPPKPVPDAIRNFILPPAVPNAAVTQRFFVAMHQFAAAAAAAAAASPNQHRAQPKPSQSNKSRQYGFIRRPF